MNVELERAKQCINAMIKLGVMYGLSAHGIQVSELIMNSIAQEVLANINCTSTKWALNELSRE